MKTVRILFPDRLDKPTGGLSIVASKIKKFLSKDFNLEFIGQPQDIEMENYRETSMPIPIHHGPLNTATGQIAYFAQAIKGKKPDLIHAFDWTVFLAGAYTAHHYNVPLICSMQLSINKLNLSGISYAGDLKNTDGFWINETHKEIEILGLNSATKIIHVSENYFKGFELYKDKSVIIQNGIDLEDFKEERITLPGKNPIKVVYIGRFAVMKNIHSLVKSNIPEGIDLIYVGGKNGGELEVFNMMIDHVETAPNKNVYYIGEKYGEEKSKVLASADAIIFPSIHEPFGIVGLEAMASKCILLTSRVDGISDYANDTNSIYCGTDPNTISLSLMYLRNLTVEQKSTYIENGLETVKKFSWDKSIEKYKSIYEELLS